MPTMFRRRRRHHQWGPLVATISAPGSSPRSLEFAALRSELVPIWVEVEEGRCFQLLSPFGLFLDALCPRGELAFGSARVVLVIDYLNRH